MEKCSAELIKNNSELQFEIKKRKFSFSLYDISGKENLENLYNFIINTMFLEQKIVVITFEKNNDEKNTEICEDFIKELNADISDCFKEIEAFEKTSN